MKFKNIIVIVLCLGIFSTAEAQLLKKLRKKAEQAAERTLLRKTDEIVSKKTEKTIDDATYKKDRKEKDKESDSKKPSKVKSTTVIKELADIHLQNSVEPFETHIGGSVTFTITVSNKGPAVAKHVTAIDKFPSGYTINNVTTTQGNYNKTTGIWDIGEMKAWSREVLTVMVTVIDVSNLMTLAEITNSSVKDPDSTPNNGVDTNGNGLVVDDRGDEDDGDGQDVKIVEEELSSGSGSDNTDIDSNNPNIGNSGVDVKMVLKHKKDKIISYLDFDTMAMRMEYHNKRKNPDPVYWDKDGYIYSGEKGNYYKIPFDEVKNLGKNIVKMFSTGSEGMGMVLPKVNGEVVSPEWPSEPIVYNGYTLHVYINRYPMIEWVFIYKPEIFEGADNIKKELLDCRGNSGCTKFTVIKGEDLGSTVLFDSKNRLAEITNPDGASAVYTYEPATVTLPPAQSFNFKFKN